MAKSGLRTASNKQQYIIALLMIGIVAIVFYFLSPFVGYRVAAFSLLVTVSLLAMFLDIVPVLLAAILSALVWDFFFIPPRYTFSVGDTEDRLTLLMYLLVALINTVLTFKIRKAERRAQEKEEREHSVKLYNTLLNSLSHELRTPIAAIIGATDNLLSDNTRLTPQNRHELITEIAKASFRLNQQVDNLLNMSRLESGFIQAKNDWCDINELVYDVVKRIEENKIKQTIHISISPDLPLFKTDTGMLEQVLYNLLNNATQYSPPETVISISAACHVDLLELIIEDNGPGFPPEEIKYVFDKFYRLKSSQTGGTGLGLSIVKGFIEAMKGTVRLENRTTGGARFIIQIPAETNYLKNLKNE